VDAVRFADNPEKIKPKPRRRWFYMRDVRCVLCTGHRPHRPITTYRVFERWTVAVCAWCLGDLPWWDIEEAIEKILTERFERDADIFLADVAELDQGNMQKFLELAPGTVIRANLQ